MISLLQSEQQEYMCGLMKQELMNLTLICSTLQRWCFASCLCLSSPLQLMLKVFTGYNDPICKFYSSKGFLVTCLIFVSFVSLLKSRSWTRINQNAFCSLWMQSTKEPQASTRSHVPPCVRQCSHGKLKANIINDSSRIVSSKHMH